MLLWYALWNRLSITIPGVVLILVRSFPTVGAGILAISNCNLHDDGVELIGKTLFLGGIVRRQVLYLIEETMPIASLALDFDLDQKF